MSRETVNREFDNLQQNISNNSIHSIHDESNIEEESNLEFFDAKETVFYDNELFSDDNSKNQTSPNNIRIKANVIYSQTSNPSDNNENQNEIEYCKDENSCNNNNSNAEKIENRGFNNNSNLTNPFSLTPILRVRRPSTSESTKQHPWDKHSLLSEDRASAARALAAAEQTISERFGTTAIEHPIIRTINRSPRHQFQSYSEISNELSQSQNLSDTMKTNVLNEDETSRSPFVPLFDSNNEINNNSNNNIPNEFVQFKNLDTGEVNILPLEMVSAASRLPATRKLTNSNDHQNDDTFFDIFNSNSETYKKLQKHLERLSEQRKRRALRTQSGIGTLDDSDDESNDDSYNSSEDDDEVEVSLNSTQRMEPIVGLWSRLFTRSKAIHDTTKGKTKSISQGEKKNTISFW